MAKKIFVNLAVKDLVKTKEFFSKLGFKFNAKFSDNNAVCMIISENIYSMLIVEKLFSTFTKKPIVDAKKSTEAILAIQFDSKKEVEEIFAKAIKAGAKESREKQDLGWMFVRQFEDLDGHIWELFFMNEKKFKKS